MYETWFSMAGVTFILYLFVVEGAPWPVHLLAFLVMVAFFTLGVLDLYGVITPTK